MWYDYFVNTFDREEPIQVSGCIEADNTKEAIAKIKTLYSGMEIGYEFLELKERERFLSNNLFKTDCLRPSISERERILMRCFKENTR